MCGILITKTEEMAGVISHRGIEHKIVEGQHGDKLVHHRLPIQTADGDDWSQPYRVKIKVNSDLYLLFNGEIFNYDKTRFDSDTEYLVDFFNRMSNSYNDLFEVLCTMGIHDILTWDGFWSIVLYDGIKKEIIAFTDPLGKKQLYINEIGEVCSEVKGLVNGASELDPTYMGAIHKWGYNHDTRTPFKNIKRLKPNTIHHWKLGSHEMMRTYENYFDFYSGLPQGCDTYENRVLWLRNKMWESVENRLLSKDYPISVLLSGGLDSSIIGGLLVAMDADVNWYTIENDEEEFVQMCEKKWGIEVTRLKYDMDLENEAVIEDLKEIYCKWNESPIDLGSVAPQYYLFEAVRKETNDRIVISGDGADELFGGYRRIDKYDSQGSDVLHELTYYHLPRLDRMSMAHTIELRNPFLNHEIVQFALALPFEERYKKQILKDTFDDIVPQEIIDRAKAPLKNEHIKKDPLVYREFVIGLFEDYWRDYLIQVNEPKINSTELENN